MKKILTILIVTCLLCGCGKVTTEDVYKDFVNNIESSKSYKLSGVMEISNDEETFTYSLESYYLKDNYYKVILVNQTNNHEQIILKNNEDVYVITPALNKSFKFQSDWPNNSSQAYLLDNLKNDVKNDEKREIKELDEGYVIKSAVNYPNNPDLSYQKIYLNSEKNVEKVEVFNNNDIVKIKVTFNDIDLKAKLKDNDFGLEEYLKNEVDNKCTEDDCAEDKTNEESKENSTGESEETSKIDNIIYPLYIPSNTYLTTSETVDTETGNRVILTFSGEKSFVLIEEKTFSNSEMEIVPVYGEPLMLSESIGALSANSLSWSVGNVSYYLASTELNPTEMQEIANSLGNSTLASTTK